MKNNRRNFLRKVTVGASALIVLKPSKSFATPTTASPGTGWVGPYTSEAAARAAAEVDDTWYTNDWILLHQACTTYADGVTWVEGTIDMWTGQVTLGHYSDIIKTHCEWYYKD